MQHPKISAFQFRAVLLALLGLGAILTQSSATAAGFRTIPESELCRTHMSVDQGWLRYCRSLPLGEKSDTIRRVVIGIHGTNRNAVSYYQHLERLAEQEGVLDETQIIVPQFVTQPDVKAHQLDEKYLYWTSEGWKHGHRSANHERHSSFVILDRLIRRAVAHHEKLEQIVIVGHSAGGEYVQRHAAGRNINVAPLAKRLRYVITNPGTYMYLSAERPVELGCGPTYNEYGYGYDRNKLSYFSGVSPDTLWQRFTEHPVALLLGDQDTDTQEIDTACAARAQGKHRFARGVYFFDQLSKTRPTHVSVERLRRVSRHVVTGIGHDFERMWDSHCGRSLIYGDGNCSKARFSAASSKPTGVFEPLQTR